ncbi:MAG: adenylate/guanylate cyclase domain-containing protein [Chloroflexota bacterium]
MGIQKKSLDQADEVRPAGSGRVDVVSLGDFVVGRTTLPPGWRWSVDVKPIAQTELCTYHHLSVGIQGRMRARMADGSEMEFGPGDVVEMSPGHDAWVVGAEPYVGVDFAGIRSFARPIAGSGERVLATIMITDIVGSTEHAERLGAAAWRDLLGRHYETVHQELDRFRGREVKTTGDGVLAVFDGAERAVRCGGAIAAKVSQLGIEVRVGVHTGEIELLTGDVRGLAVHTAARIGALASPGEVLVSATTRELLDGSSLAFLDRGTHELKGLSGGRALFALGAPG